MALEPILLRSRSLRLHKSVNGAQFEIRSVLTSNPFNYVDLWLRRQHKEDALFYWRQARSFYHAAKDLPIESAPLVLYYCYMNAAKALLAAYGVPFDEHHGLRAHRMRGGNSKVVLSNEGIKILSRGIAPALSGYLGETEPAQIHSLEDVLYNIVCIHRTYCLTYPRSTEMFLPLRTTEYVRDASTGAVHLKALAVSDIDWRSFRKALPAGFQALPSPEVGVISTAHVIWSSRSNPTEVELDALRNLNQNLRSHLHYICGGQTLWYLKTDGARRIARRSMTLTLAAMHRLSEICRYKPAELLSFLNGQKNWLLSEFVGMSCEQYLDEIACEMTGHQIMVPNVRPPV